MASWIQSRLLAAMALATIAGCGRQPAVLEPAAATTAVNLELTEERLLQLLRVESAIRVAQTEYDQARRQRGEALASIATERFTPGPPRPNAATIATSLGLDPVDIELTRRQVRELAMLRWSAADRATTRRFREAHVANLERRRATVTDAEQLRDVELSIAEVEAGIERDRAAEAVATATAPQLALVERYAAELGPLWTVIPDDGSASSEQPDPDVAAPPAEPEAPPAGG